MAQGDRRAALPLQCVSLRGPSLLRAGCPADLRSVPQMRRQVLEEPAGSPGPLPGIDPALGSMGGRTPKLDPSPYLRYAGADYGAKLISVYRIPSGFHISPPFLVYVLTLSGPTESPAIVLWSRCTYRNRPFTLCREMLRSICNSTPSPSLHPRSCHKLHIFLSFFYSSLHIASQQG